MSRYQNSGYKPETLRRGAIASVRTFKVLHKAEEDGRPIVKFRITTETVDRGNDIVRAQGADLKNYMQNPVVLWGHDHKIPAIAKTLELKVGDTYIDAVTEFHGKTELSREVGALVAGGYLRTASIGLLPLQFGRELPVTSQMIESGQAYPGIRTIRQIERWELTEWSVVNVPMNQHALIQNSFDAVLRRAVNDSVIRPDAEIIRRTSDPPRVRLADIENDVLAAARKRQLFAEVIARAANKF